MIQIRRFFINICDSLLTFLTLFRRILTLGPKDARYLPDTKVIDFFPYDAVILKEETISKNLEAKPLGSIYSIGVIIGYTHLDNQGFPKKVKVSFFNPADPTFPEVRDISLTKLQVVSSPLRTLQMLSNLLGINRQPIKTEDDLIQ